jgi:hypothetical protein
MINEVRMPILLRLLIDDEHGSVPQYHISAYENDPHKYHATRMYFPLSTVKKKVHDGQTDSKIILTTNGNRSQAACFQGKARLMLSRQVGSDPRHLLSRQVSRRPLHQWCDNVLVKVLKYESEVG